MSWDQQEGWGGQQQQGNWGQQQQGGWNQGGGYNQQHEAPLQYFAIKCKAGGRCLDVAQDGPEKGNLIIWDYWGGPNQQWGFVSEGGQKMLVNKQGQYLTIEQSSNQDGANIIGAPYQGAPGQKFGLQPVK